MSDFKKLKMALEKRQRWKLGRSCNRWVKSWILQQRSQWAIPFFAIRFTCTDSLCWTTNQCDWPTVWDTPERLGPKMLTDSPYTVALHLLSIWCNCVWQLDTGGHFKNAALSSTRGIVNHLATKRWIRSFQRVLSCLMYKDDEWYIWRFPSPETPWTTRWIFFLFFLFVRGSQGVVSPVPMVLVAMVANKAYIKAVKVWNRCWTERRSQLLPLVVSK